MNAHFLLGFLFSKWRWFYINIPGRKSESDISHNTKTKVYPDGTKKVICCNRPIFHEPGYELASSRYVPEPRTYNTANPTRSDSLKRAKESVFDIVACNRFEYFVTLTVSPDNLRGIDRYDPVQLKKYLCNWLHNQVQRKGIRYVLVPGITKTALFIFTAYSPVLLALIPVRS